MKNLLSSIVCCLGVVAVAPVFASESLVIDKQWIRETLPSMNMTAGYFHIQNSSSEDKVIVSAESSCSKRVEIHEHTFVDGLMKMQQVKSLRVKKGESVSLTPGGYHLMMFEVTDNLKRGKFCDIHLTFQDGAKQSFKAPVRSLVK